MKKLSKFLLFSTLIAWFGKDGICQPMTVAPDCTINFSFTAAAQRSITFQNFSAASPLGCVVWVVGYRSQGFSAVSLEVDSAPDALSAGVHVPGTWESITANDARIEDGGFSGTPAGPGVNPNTNTRSGWTTFAGVPAWVSVTLSSKTGTGSVSGTLLGWRPHGVDQTTAAAAPPGGTCPGGSVDGEVQFKSGADCAGDPTITVSPIANSLYQWNPTNGTSMTGLLISNAGVEPDLSCCDGPGSSMSIVRNSTGDGVPSISFNFVGAGGPQAYPEISTYFSRGTIASPANISIGDKIWNEDYLGRVGDAWSYLGALYAQYQGTYTELTLLADGGQFNFSDGIFELGFHPISSTTAEVNNGTPVSAGGALISVQQAGGSPNTVALWTADGKTLGFFGGATFASLGAPSDGTQSPCSDCTVSSAIDNTCAGSGSGAQAFRINGAWKCVI